MRINDGLEAPPLQNSAAEEAVSERDQPDRHSSGIGGDDCNQFISSADTQSLELVGEDLSAEGTGAPDLASRPVPIQGVLLAAAPPSIPV